MKCAKPRISWKAFDEVAIDLYAEKTSKSEKDLAAMMDRETWLSGKRAVEEGFADGYLTSDEKFATKEGDEPTNKLRQIDSLLAKANVPRNQRRELINGFKQDMRDAVLSGTQDAASEKLESQILKLAENL